MLTPQQLSEAFARNVSILKAQADGLNHADSLLQPPVRGNCLNWILGHLADNRNRILASVGEEPAIEPARIARYQRESGAVLADGDGVLQIGDLLAALESSQERLAARLAAMSEADLAREQPLGQRSVSTGQALFFRYFHETYHTGQAELLRQLAGKDDKVI